MLRNVVDGFIKIFKENDLELLSSFSDKKQSDLELVVEIDDIKKSFPTKKVYEIRLTFSGQSYISTDKSKINIYEKLTTTSSLLNSLTISKLKEALNEDVIFFQIEESESFGSDMDVHTFGITYLLAIDNFDL